MKQRAVDSSAPGDARDDGDAREFETFAHGQDPLDIAAATWVARKRNGLSATDEAELRAWLAADPRHGAAYEDMDDTFEQVRDLPDDEVGALKAGLGATATEAAASTCQPVKAPAQRHRAASPGRRAWLIDIGRLFPQAAAAVVAFMLFGGGWMGWQHWQGQPTFDKTYATTRGQQLTAKLPDGSTLVLDTATRAEVRLYRDRRDVQLTDGQAMFAVQADAQRPFRVRAGALRITVVGTRFSVRHTQSGLGAGSTVIAVEEGRVRVERVERTNGVDSAASSGAADRDASVLLTAGQTVVADDSAGLGPVTDLPAAAMAPWREGRVSFDSTPLAQAVAEFERYGNTGLIVRDPAVAAMRVGGSYGLRQSQRFASALPELLPVRLVRRGESTEVVAR